MSNRIDQITPFTAEDACQLGTCRFDTMVDTRTANLLERIINYIKDACEDGHVSGQVVLIHATTYSPQYSLQKNEIRVEGTTANMTQDMIDIISAKFKEWGYDVETDINHQKRDEDRKLVMFTTISW